jgi:hypothetical protein
LSLDHDQVVGLIDKMDRETKAIRSESLRFTWFMRGGVSYDEAMQLSKQEREIIGKIIEEHMEATKTSGMPFF